MIENIINSNCTGFCNIHGGTDVKMGFRFEKLKELYNIVMGPKKVGWHGMERINLSQDTDKNRLF
jgi:hypothetical protein